MTPDFTNMAYSKEAQKTRRLEVILGFVQTNITKSTPLGVEFAWNLKIGHDLPLSE